MKGAVSKSRPWSKVKPHHMQRQTSTVAVRSRWTNRWRHGFFFIPCLPCSVPLLALLQLACLASSLGAALVVRAWP